MKGTAYRRPDKVPRKQTMWKLATLRPSVRAKVSPAPGSAYFQLLPARALSRTETRKRSLALFGRGEFRGEAGCGVGSEKEMTSVPLYSHDLVEERHAPTALLPSASYTHQLSLPCYQTCHGYS